MNTTEKESNHDPFFYETSKSELRYTLDPVSNRYLITFANSSREFSEKIKNLLIAILKNCSSISVIKNVTINFYDKFPIFSNDCFLYYSENYQDRILSFSVDYLNSDYYIQFFIEEYGKPRKPIGNISMFDSNKNFCMFMENFLHNLGEKKFNKWKFGNSSGFDQK